VSIDRWSEDVILVKRCVAYPTAFNIAAARSIPRTDAVTMRVVVLSKSVRARYQ